MDFDIIGLANNLIDKVIPDAVERQKAKTELLRQHQNGDLKEMEIALSAIIAEARSKDPWTSRARPSFMYVMYIMLLASIPMGVFYMLSPEEASAVTHGVGVWLNSIPQELYALFGAGYLGYTANRTKDKAIQSGYEVKPGLLSKLLG